jgi:hypothetical protein
MSATAVISVPIWGQREQTIALNSEHGSFLSPCPITSRNDVIPSGYNGRTKQIRHLDISLKRPASRKQAL